MTVHEYLRYIAAYPSLSRALCEKLRIHPAANVAAICVMHYIHTGNVCNAAICTALGFSPATIRAWLSKHGYLTRSGKAANWHLTTTGTARIIDLLPAIEHQVQKLHPREKHLPH